MAINIAKTGKYNAVVGVVLFGVGLSIIQLYLLSSMHPPSALIPLIIGLIGAYSIDYLYWKPYIGYTSFYQARAIWAPLIIAVILAILVIFSSIAPLHK